MTQRNLSRIQQLEEEIAALKRQWPAHSTPPAMLMQLDELEDELARELAEVEAENRPRPMWTCPECGRQFVNTNTFHSCGYYDIEDHFVGKGEVVRQIFEKLKTEAEEIGPVTVYAQKTRIVFQARTRFVALMPRKKWMTGHIWLERKTEHPRIYHIEMYTYRDFGHQFRLHSPEQIDEEFIALLQEAYTLASA